ncbi:hypothetical protein [Micromonospora sp. U21]|uniref:hypothetical protein n=1 Tax=Micromonospora sp. U21 TaxID=2824899 RepID=UPI001B371B21|nr:hypothetical protein [Micromonospora sp. U21]MBQ0904423.1 hypothetical protein [Micromonospora sp. U21]
MIALAILAVGFAGWLVTQLPDEAGTRTSIIMLAVGLLTGLALGALSATLLLQRRSRIVEIQRGYKWISAEFHYEIDEQDPHQHTHFVKIYIEATRDGAFLFRNQYLWSGSGSEAPLEVTSKGHRLLGEVKKSSGWAAYYVDLGHEMQKGERSCVEIVQRLTDSGEKFDPFIAKTVQERIDELTLSISLPQHLRPLAVWRIERTGFGPGAKVVRRDQGELGNGSPTAVFVKKNPKIGHNYELLWEYQHGRSIYG